MNKTVYITGEISMKRRQLGDVVYLEVVEQARKADKLPVVFYYHGFTGNKEWHSQDGYELAKRGFRVLIPDAFLHGERLEKPLSNADFPRFWEIITHSLAEFQLLKDHYINQQLIDETRIGVVGASMGGITTSALFTSNPEIKAAVVLMGSPRPMAFTKAMLTGELQSVLEKTTDIAKLEAQIASVDLSLHPQNIAQRPLLFWHDKQDTTVPYEGTYSFYEAIKDEAYAKNVSFETTDGYGHEVKYYTTLMLANFFANNL